MSNMSDLLIHVSRRAMACEFEVRFPAERYRQGTEAALEALDLVESLEAEISYFQPGSQISRINALAADGPVEVSPPLFALLRLAMSLYEETEGAYDITSTPLWETWGFARRAGAIPSDAQLAEARARVGGHLVELDRERRTIRFRRSGVRINLGSIGKGHALDVCGQRLTDLGMADFVFHGGQSSVLARGFHLPETPDESPSPSRHWEIGIRDPRQPGRRLGIVRLHDRGLGTSSGQFQSFRHRGRRYGHILDPRSGWPAEGMLATTVVAPTAALADALSTAFYVMGASRSLDYCRTHPEIGAVLITCQDAGSGRVEVHTAGFRQDEVVINES
jgi:thiamine biosynthesis lipoprotein